MVQEQLASPTRRIHDAGVLRAMTEVPRHEFVPSDERSSAYGDHAMPIGYGQTISQPYIVALMTETLALHGSERVLEIGTGCGYQAAVLSRLAAEVHTVEIVQALAEQAKATFERLGYQNVHGHLGDGHLGWPEAAPFDAIIVTCAPERVPTALIQQLKEGGRLIVPVGPIEGPQELHLLKKHRGGTKTRVVLPVRFVPMTGSQAADTEEQGPLSGTDWE